jgi:hypothetical protein
VSVAWCGQQVKCKEEKNNEHSQPPLDTHPEVMLLGLPGGTDLCVETISEHATYQNNECNEQQ